MTSIAWGPFDDPVDAANNLGRFTDQVLDPQYGIAWIGNGTLYTLRAPTYDPNGDAEVIVFEYRPAPPARGAAQRRGRSHPGLVQASA